MKLKLFIQSSLIALMLMVTGLVAQAQEKALDVNVDMTKTTSSSSWYASPWVWIVGAAVFILLLAAIMRGGDRRTDA
jgi:uncharacterized membrane protein YdcZ (DUF606 family)